MQNDIQMVHQIFHSFTESGLAVASVIRKVYTAVSMQLAPAMEALLRTLADVHSEDGPICGTKVRFTGIFIILIGDALIKRIENPYSSVCFCFCRVENPSSNFRSAYIWYVYIYI